MTPESNAVVLLAAVTRHGPWLQAAAERRSSAEEINKNLAENAFKDNDTSPAARTNIIITEINMHVNPSVTPCTRSRQY